MDPSFALLIGIVWAAWATQTVCGFGAMLITVTLGAHLFEIPTLVTLVVPLSLTQTSYVAVRYRGAIQWRLLLTGILPLMGLGMLVATWVEGRIAGTGLRTAFAILVLVLSTRELIALHGRGNGTRPELGSFAYAGLMLATGFVHGVYATGGPILVYLLARRGLSKQAFRSTLTVLWLILNSALTIRFWLEGRFDAEMGWRLLALLPTVPAGIWIGEILHRRVEEQRFRTITFVMLIAAAGALLWR